MGNNETSLLVMLDRVVSAARGIFHVHASYPNATVRQELFNCCVVEMSEALADLELRTGAIFNSADYVAELYKRSKEKELQERHEAPYYEVLTQDLI